MKDSTNPVRVQPETECECGVCRGGSAVEAWTCACRCHQPTPAEQAALRVPGDIFQINENHGRKGWIGALVYAEDIKPWGVVGFIAWPEKHEEQVRAYIRLDWKEIDYIGHAALELEP